MNPWVDLLRPIRSRPGEPLQKLPPKPEWTPKPVAAAALVVTDTGIFDRPDVRLVPIIVYEFAQ